MLVRTCSRRLLSPLLQTNSSICRLIRPPLTFTTSIGNCPPSNSSSVPSPPRMEASVTEDFVHVSDPIIYSVYDDETGNDPNTLPSDDVVSHAPSNPEDFLKSVIRLECDSAAGEDGVCKVYLVGTAHVSKESCKEVQQVIESLKPEVVFLELCMSRIAVLNPPERFQAPTVREMIENLKGKDSNALGVLYAWLLAKIAGQLEVFPGAEFHVAFEEARNYGAKIILGDRPVQITLRRTWGKMPLWHKVKFVYRMLFQAMFIPSAADIQKMLNDIEDEDMITLLIQEMSREFPTIMETLVYERDMFMSSKLLEVASNHSSVVAVVGKGHLSGIKKHWKKPIELDRIMEIPPSSSFPNMAAILSLGVIGAAIISGVYIFRKS